MSHDINILVNGSRCKQYSHEGRLYIEAKRGSEYTIEIKNNEWQRILAICSVDGLNILNGKQTKEDDAGYVINGWSAGKFDGFRVSNEKVAKFIFDYKDSSYAASKENGSEKNVGVVGIRIFKEKEKPLPPPPEIHHHHYPKVKPWSPYDPWTPYRPIIWNDITYGSSCCTGDRLMGSTLRIDSNTIADYSGDDIPTKGIRRASGNYLRGRVTTQNASFKISKSPTRGFDMGTKWGEAKESRVIEVEFEKGILALSTNIYYASHQSLIEMGVPLGNEKQVRFPEPFTDSKYAEPPKGWNG